MIPPELLFTLFTLPLTVLTVLVAYILSDNTLAPLWGEPIGVRLAGPNGAPLVPTGRTRRASLASHSRGALAVVHLAPLAQCRGAPGHLPSCALALLGTCPPAPLGGARRPWPLRQGAHSWGAHLAQCRGELGHLPSCALAHLGTCPPAPLGRAKRPWPLWQRPTGALGPYGKAPLGRAH